MGDIITSPCVTTMIGMGFTRYSASKPHELCGWDPTSLVLGGNDIAAGGSLVQLRGAA